MAPSVASLPFLQKLTISAQGRISTSFSARVYFGMVGEGKGCATVKPLSGLASSTWAIPYPNEYQHPAPSANRHTRCSSTSHTCAPYAHELMNFGLTPLTNLSAPLLKVWVAPGITFVALSYSSFDFVMSISSPFGGGLSDPHGVQI